MRQGYDATHPDIELLKLKNYTVGIPIDENILCKDNAQEKLGEYFRALEKYVSNNASQTLFREETNRLQVTFVNSIVMPDPGLDDSDSDDDEDDEDEGDD